MGRGRARGALRVLHVRGTVGRAAGGPTTVLAGLANAQARRGHEVTVCTTDREHPPSSRLAKGALSELFSGSVRVKAFPVIVPSMLFSPSMARWLRHAITNYDVVHIHGLYRFPPTYAAYQARRQGVPYVVRPHGTLDPYLYDRGAHNVLLKRMYERLFDLRTINSASAIHFTAEEERQRAAFWNIRAPSFIVPNGIDAKRFDVLPDRGAFRSRYGLGNAPLVLFLGRLHFTKGLDLLVAAFEEVKRRLPRARLAIVGPDNDGYGRTVRRWVDERKLDEAVRFIDQLDFRGVTEAYVDSDVFVLPSYTENFGMAVVEAMACSLPVVISDQVNIWRGVERAGAGVATKCDVREIADAVLELLASPDRRTRMGAAGRALAQNAYSWDAVVDRLTDEYWRALSVTRE